MSVNVNIPDLGKLAEPATKLIEAVRAAVGTLYEPKRIRDEAHAKADALILTTKADLQAKQLVTRAAERLTQKEIRRQGTIEAVIEKAILELPDAVSPKKIDVDWTVDFFERCQDIGNADMQRFWAKVLAGEVGNPGTFSRRCLATLQSISSDDARIFTKLCGMTFIRVDGTVFHWVQSPHVDSSEFGISYTDLLELDSIGLIQMDSTELTVSWDSAPELLHFGDKKLFLYPNRVNDAFVIRDLVLFTTVGRTLLPIVSSTPNDHYYEVAVKIFSESLYVSDLPPRAPTSAGVLGKDRTALYA